MICPSCNAQTIRKKVPYSLLGEQLGSFLADYCPRCKEHYFNKDVALQIEKIAKDKGLWNLKSKTKIDKVGNALAIRLNKRLVDYLSLKKGEEVVIYPESKNKIVIGISRL